MSKERELIKRVADRTAVTRRSVAEVIRQAKAEAWDEGRESVGEQMLQPRDEYGMFPPVTNPYRGGQ